MGFWQRLMGRPAPDDFAAMVSDAMHAAGVGQVRYDRDSFSLHDDDGTTYLQAVYQEFLAYPRNQRSELLARFVRATVEGRRSGPESYSRRQLAEQLLPRVRSRSFYEGMRDQLLMAGREQDEEPASYRPLSQHLAVGLVMDFPDRIEEGPPSRYQASGLSLDEAYALALRNLDRISHQPFERIGPGLFVSPWRDNHDAARLLLTERIAALPLRGLPVVMAAHRDVLFISATQERQGLLQMAEHATQLAHQPRAISSIPLCLIDGAWAPYVPGPEEETCEVFAQLRLQQLSGEYATQRTQLRHRLEREGDDQTFVAGYTAMAAADEPPFSYCVWTKGVDSWLPRTDRVALLDPERAPEPVLCAWETLSEVVGDALSPLPVYPPRYRTGPFPSESQLAALSPS